MAIRLVIRKNYRKQDWISLKTGGKGDSRLGSHTGKGQRFARPYLVPGCMPVVVILPVGQHPFFYLLIPALCSHLQPATASINPPAAKATVTQSIEDNCDFLNSPHSFSFKGSSHFSSSSRRKR